MDILPTVENFEELLVEEKTFRKKETGVINNSKISSSSSSSPIGVKIICSRF